LKTIKLPYKTDEDLTSIFKQYSSVVRYSYNRFIDGMNEKEIRLMIKELSNIDLLNSWLIQCAILDGKAMQKRFEDKKVVFGGKFNFINRLKGKISKNEFDLKRLSPLNIQGEVLKKGNRSFELDIIENNKIVFKLNKAKHIELYLPKLRSNIKKELYRIQQLNEVKYNEQGYTFSVRFDMKYVYISFEEFKNEEVKQLNENRYLGIDLNPDTIGISVLENNQVIYAQEFSLKLIFDRILNKNLSSDSVKMKYYQNKLGFETIEIAKSVSLIARRFGCKTVYVEDLKFNQKLSKEQKHNHLGNRKCRNLWKRDKFISNLTKRLNVLGIGLYEVNPAYSSFIGNLMYEYTDAVNASIEIARRGFEYRIKKSKIGFYPVFDVKHRWKEMVASFKDWKEFYIEVVKNSRLKYRVSLDECKYLFDVFKQNSHKSMVLNYVFRDKI